MEYRLRGLSGCTVSELALGTLTFGNETTEAASRRRSSWHPAGGGPRRRPGRRPPGPPLAGSVSS